MFSNFSRILWIFAPCFGILLGVPRFCSVLWRFPQCFDVLLGALRLCSVFSDFSWFYGILLGVSLFFPEFLVLGGPNKIPNTNLYSRPHSTFGWSNQNSKPKYAITIRLYDVSRLKEKNK
jgi:hypothetical protein